MERGGGLITRDDLARYRAKWRAPLQIDYRGYTIYTMPPPSGGGVTLAEILNTMEGFGSLPAFGSARLLHLQARRCAARTPTATPSSATPTSSRCRSSG